MGITNRFKKFFVNGKNFKYLDDLIHSGIEKIILDSDVILDTNEMSEYLEGVKLDVDDIVIDGAGHTIDACGKTRIFEAIGKNITIKNVTFKNGVNVSGAAINNLSTSLQIINCIFSDNETQEDGGAIQNQDDCELILDNCAFKKNISQRNGGSISNFGKIVCRGVRFSNNSSKRDGGAIHNQNDCEMTLDKCFFSENISQSNGGGISNFGNITCRDVDFSGNVSKRDGGAINNHDCEIILERCVFTNNIAEKSGGAILNFDKLNCKDVVFSQNYSKLGGGAIDNLLGSVLTCTDCNFKDNRSENLGSSISNESSDAKFINCKFSFHSQKNNVVFNKRNMALMDCIFNDNNRLESVIFSDVDSMLDLLGGEIADNATRESAIYSRAQNLSISNTTFKNNTSKTHEFQGDILNEGNIILNSPDFKSNTSSVFNRKHIVVKKLSHAEVERIVENADEGSVDERFIPEEYKHDFSHLNSMILDASSQTITLDDDIVLENYELDFFEGGIEITRDNLVIEGNGHTVDAKNRTRIFNVLGKNITIKDVIFKNGYVANRYGEHIAGGGAIKTVRNSSLTLINCQFIHNSSENDGGAILNNGTLQSKNNKYVNNKSKYNGGAIRNNCILHTTMDVFEENNAKIAGTIYNNKKLTISEEINLSNNKSDFKQPIYNANEVMIENIGVDVDEMIYNTYKVGKSETGQWKSVQYLKDILEGTHDVLLDGNIKFECGDNEEICLSDIALDGNGHEIDLNHHNLSFKIVGESIFKNITFKNAFINENSLFEIKSNVKFENVKFINNKIATDCNLINNEEFNVEIIGSGFYNNSSKNFSLISNGGQLTIVATEFTNNDSDAKGTIINNLIDNENDVLIKDSSFVNNFSTKNGGVIFNQEHTIFKIKDTQFKNNTSKLNGGSLYNAGEFNILNCIFKGNVSNNGGAIYNSLNSILKINDSAFNENTAQEDGGAINNFGKIGCHNDEFAKNSTKRNGGAINNQRDGILVLGKCTFNENVAQKNGGGLYIINNKHVKLNECNFNDNKPDSIY